MAKDLGRYSHSIKVVVKTCEVLKRRYSKRHNEQKNQGHPEIELQYQMLKFLLTTEGDVNSLRFTKGLRKALLEEHDYQNKLFHC